MAKKTIGSVDLVKQVPPAATTKNVPPQACAAWRTGDWTSLEVAADALDEVRDGSGLWCRRAAWLVKQLCEPTFTAPRCDPAIAAGVLRAWREVDEWAYHAGCVLVFGPDGHDHTGPWMSDMDKLWRCCLGLVTRRAVPRPAVVTVHDVGTPGSRGYIGVEIRFGTTLSVIAGPENEMWLCRVVHVVREYVRTFKATPLPIGWYAVVRRQVAGA